MGDFRGRYHDDGSLAGISLADGVFERETEWSEDLFEMSDPRFLRRDEDTITVCTDEGTATYRVTDRLSNPVTGTILKTVLVEVAPA